MSNRISLLLNKCAQSVRHHLAQPCLLCAARSLEGPLCPGCHADLPPLPALRCPICAESTADGSPCGHCLKRPPAFVRTHAALSYAYPVDGLIQRLKYGHELIIAPLLAEILWPVVQTAPRPDVIIPMPLHPARLAERGFNQAAEIGRPLAQRLGIPMQVDSARRIRNTPAQAGLVHAARLKNLQNAFVCNTPVHGQRVAVLDDVMTTGTSLDALARSLLDAGASEVEAWVVARTPEFRRR